MDQINWKRFLKTLLKFAISGIALYIVFRNIDWVKTWSVLFSANIWYLSIATFFFIGSKILSALRLNLYFSSIPLKLSERYNLRLYWVGMFYNLFLPGGIGGDGYKVYLLNRQYKSRVKHLISATLLDRISGMIALLFLAGLGYLLLNEPPFSSLLIPVSVAGLLTIYPVFWWAGKTIFPRFSDSFWSANFYSLGVQGLQVISAYFILISIGVEEKYLAYQVLFLISSVVAVFPFTIGGVGARELTFILGYQYLGISENVSVAFSLLFFLITAVVSLIGGFLREGD